MKHDKITCIKVFLVSIVLSSLGVDLSSPIPIHMIAKEPAPSKINFTIGTFSMMAPMPKKHDKANEISKKIVTNITKYNLDLLCVIAVFTTYKFCIPIGATYAIPIVNPLINVSNIIFCPPICPLYYKIIINL
jgi:hypothetical protein